MAHFVFKCNKEDYLSLRPAKLLSSTSLPLSKSGGKQKLNVNYFCKQQYEPGNFEAATMFSYEWNFKPGY
jgi:hypothetical protein